MTGGMTGGITGGLGGTPARKRILLLNANTTPGMTHAMCARAAALAPPHIAFEPVTGRFGGAYISSRVTAAIAAHAVLDAYAEHATGCDGVLIGCFGDPGLLALREIADVPVTGLAEASCIAAAKIGRFGIVTGGVKWEAMLGEFIHSLGLGDRLARVRAVAPTGGEIAQDPDAAHGLLAKACEACVREDGAHCVILGGAGLIGIAARIKDRVSVPVFCSVETGIAAMVAMVEAGATGAPDPVAVPSKGLTAKLAGLLAG